MRRFRSAMSVFRESAVMIQLHFRKSLERKRGAIQVIQRRHRSRLRAIWALSGMEIVLAKRIEATIVLQKHYRASVGRARALRRKRYRARQERAVLPAQRHAHSVLRDGIVQLKHRYAYAVLSDSGATPTCCQALVVQIRRIANTARGGALLPQLARCAAWPVHLVAS